MEIWSCIEGRAGKQGAAAVAVKKEGIGILLPKLFWPTVRKKLLKFEAEGWEFAKPMRSLEQFIQTVKGQNNFW